MVSGTLPCKPRPGLSSGCRTLDKAPTSFLLALLSISFVLMRSLLAGGEVAFVATRKLREPRRTDYPDLDADIVNQIVSLSDLPPRQISFMMMAYGEAAKSPLHNQHGAVIVKNGEVIAKGHNRIPCFTQKASYTRHAEEVALRSCPPHQLRDADLYVVRCSNSFF